MQHLLASILGQANKDAAVAGLIMAFIAAYLVVLFIFTAIWVVAHWRIFTKAGQPGWAAIVPIYNVITLLRVVGLSPWWILFPLVLIIPLLGALAYIGWLIWIMHRLSKKFGHGAGFTAGLVLLNPIFILILAFGDSKYQGTPEQIPAA